MFRYDTIHDTLPVNEFCGSLRRQQTHGIILDSSSTAHRDNREQAIKWNDCTDGGYDSSDNASAPPNHLV